MEFPLNTNSAQAPEDDFSLLNNLIASGTANTDEIENGFPPESSVPSFPTRHANAQQSSLMNREIIGRESQVWKPYSTLPPRSTCPSALSTEGPSCDVVAPQSSTVLATEDENDALHLQLLLMADLGTAYDVCNPCSDQMVASSLAFPVVRCPPLKSYCPSGLGFRQNNIVHSGPFDGSSTSITKLQEYYFKEDLKRILENRREPHENINSEYPEVDHGRKKRKLSDGRRRCYCKKSKCIQRYCECFSSGFFCDDTCGCQGCNNTINAFSLHLPRIQLFGQNKKHKRGCSCTKSKCLQNYCECYQAEVKCSLACRCKGCGNMDTQEHDAANFMTSEPTNNNFNTHRFHSHGGKMLHQAEARNNRIERQGRMSSNSSVVPLQQRPPRESTSFGNPIISNRTSTPRLHRSMTFYEVSPNHNGTPSMLNNSRFPARINSPGRNWVSPPRFHVPEASSSMSTSSLSPLIPSNDGDGRSNGQGDDKKSDSPFDWLGSYFSN